MNAHLPAFPIPLNNGEAYKTHAPCDGLTKRELIAAMAMQGILANGTYDPYRRERLKVMSIAAVSAADDLIAELAKEPQA